MSDNNKFNISLDTGSISLLLFLLFIASCNSCQHLGEIADSLHKIEQHQPK